MKECRHCPEREYRYRKGWMCCCYDLKIADIESEYGECPEYRMLWPYEAIEEKELDFDEDLGDI